VEVNTLNGEDYRGTVTTKEAIKTIFIGELGFERKALGSLTIGYSKGRIITFKLVKQFDIDTLASIEDFEFKRESKNRKGEIIIDKLGCRIRGIRRARVQTQSNFTPYTDEGYRWVKIEGAEYRLDRNQIGDWLEFWGKLASDITEDNGNGTYSVKMKLDSDLPQFLPMFGKRIRLYYRGIIKKCSNCFGPHARKTCNQERVTWIEYVGELMKVKPEIPDEFYGKWAPIVHEIRVKLGGNVKVNSDTAGGVATPAIDQSKANSVKSVTPTGEAPKSLDLVVRQGAVTKTKQVNTNVEKEKRVSDQTQDVEEVNAMLSRLQDQGLEVSSSNVPNQQAGVRFVAVKSNTKSAYDTGHTGRCRSRRKASLN
jgi:hypothetical protein